MGLKIISTIGKTVGKVLSFIPVVGKVVGKAVEGVSEGLNKASDAIHGQDRGKVGESDGWDEQGSEGRRIYPVVAFRKYQEMIGDDASMRSLGLDKLSSLLVFIGAADIMSD